MTAVEEKLKINELSTLIRQYFSEGSKEIREEKINSIHKPGEINLGKKNTNKY